MQQVLDKSFEFDAFICHSSKDKPIIESLIENFKKENITYWVDAEQIPFGDQIIPKIEEGLKKSKYVIICLSKNFNASGWTKTEYGAILNAEFSGDSSRRVIPLILDICEVDDIPFVLRDKRRVTYSNKDEYNTFIKFLKKNQSEQKEVEDPLKKIEIEEPSMKITVTSATHVFEYDVFLSYSYKDENIVHTLANRFKQDGLRVWLDKWVIKPGDLIPLKIQEGLEKSRTFLMCMSPSYFESEWGNMKHLTILFRNPTNTQRRLIPLLIEDCIRPDIIAQFAYIDWRKPSDGEYKNILASCLPKTFTSPSTGMEFVLITAGKFMMGSPSCEQGRYEDEGPAHEVIIGNFFYIGKYPVTHKQWEKIMERNPSQFKGVDRPVESVSWDNVQEFIIKLNEKENTHKYRLPSESEWEYACRAGTTTRYSFGDNASELNDYASYKFHWFFNITTNNEPVGQKKPNPWGLYDMHGNVWEWCQDIWHGNYNGAPSDGSPWESGNSIYRITRGGSWEEESRKCRSANRSPYIHDHCSNSLGFRVVREI